MQKRIIKSTKIIKQITKPTKITNRITTPIVITTPSQTPTSYTKNHNFNKNHNAITDANVNKIATPTRRDRFEVNEFGSDPAGFEPVMARKIH